MNMSKLELGTNVAITLTSATCPNGVSHRTLYGRVVKTTDKAVQIRAVNARIGDCDTVWLPRVAIVSKPNQWTPEEPFMDLAAWFRPNGYVASFLGSCAVSHLGVNI